MNNFWAWVAVIVFGPFVLIPLTWAVWMFVNVLFGGATCQTCQ